MNIVQRNLPLVSPLREICGRNGADSGRSLSQSAQSAPSVAVATRMDALGRILVPVRINECGPFYLVANTGASTLALSVQAARRLKLPFDKERPIRVHGTTGSMTVPVVGIRSMQLGRWPVSVTTMPVLGDAFERADGMLGIIGLMGGQVQMDLRRHRFVLSDERVPTCKDSSATSLPMDTTQEQLIVVEARVVGTLVKTIIDTGAQFTIGNLPLQRALGGHIVVPNAQVPIIGATSHRQTGVSHPLPPVSLGTLCILGARIFYGELPLFERMGLASTPAMFLGMDVLGKMQSLTFDCTNREVQFVASGAKAKSVRRHR